MSRLTWIKIVTELYKNADDELDVLAYYRKSAKSKLETMDLVVVGNSLVVVPEGYQDEQIQYRIKNVKDLKKHIEYKISTVDGNASISMVKGKEWFMGFSVYGVEIDDYQVALDLGV